MIIRKNSIFINSILYVCLSIYLIMGSIATASETQVVTVEEIEKGAIEKLVSILPWEKDLLEINVYYKGEDIILPPGKKELIYKARANNQKAGRIPLTLQIKVNGSFHKRIKLTSRVLVTQDIVKTIHSVRKGEIISREKIQLETIQTERPWKNALTSTDQALDYEAKRNLPVGKILTAKYLKKPALVTKGDKILILAEKGTMKITAPGILKEDGYEGAMIKVLNMESKKVIYGRLVDANTVKVSF
jgi:flagellar basal body P-ring formation protein FlgA